MREKEPQAASHKPQPEEDNGPRPSEADGPCPPADCLLPPADFSRVPRTPNPDHRSPSPSTAAAILTPIGQGGIAVLHIVGPRAFEIIRQVFRPKSPSALQPDGRRLLYGHIVDEGEAVDEVLVRLVPAEEARGGEPTAEVNCHGGVAAVQRVLDCLVRRGAEAADAEALVERRARSRIEAEATHALMRATTLLGVETLLDQLHGALERALLAIPWEPADEAAAAIRRLLGTERLGRALWQPPRVALVGPTNAGKSTLFNALAREERMIVSPTPGTTRDAVSAEVAIGGVPVWLTDTAGQREPESPIEAEAILRSRSAAAEADLVLFVLDGSTDPPVPLDPLAGPSAAPRLLVVNKADLGLLPWARSMESALAVSAARGDGLDALCARIVESLAGRVDYEPGRPVVFAERQAALLRSALEAVEAGDAARARGAVIEGL